MCNVSHDVTSVTENGYCNVSHGKTDTVTSVTFLLESHLTKFQFILSVHIFQIEGGVADGHWMAK